MTIHARSEQLIATSIDFGLTPAEGAEVAGHLSTCSACRATAAAYRSDAAGLREIAFAEPPARVRAAVLAAARRPAEGGLRPWQLLAVAALVLAALGGVIAVGAWAARPALVETLPSASSSPTAAATNTVVVLNPATAHWTKVGAVDRSGTLVAFDGGYALLSGGDDGTLNAVRWSTDGRTWQTANLATLVPNCPGFGPPGNDLVADAVAGAIATNGHDLVVVGELRPHDTASCAGGGSYTPVAWHSADGRTWRRSAPFDAAGGNARASAVWATPGGWQAAVAGGAAPIWKSTDGLTWERLSDPSGTLTKRGISAIGAAPDGTILLSRGPDVASGGTSAAGLFTSPDGLTWRPLGTAGGCEVAPGATQIVGPTAAGLGAWLILDDLRLCTSRDLVAWSSTTLPGAPAVVAQTRYGAIFAGDGCSGAGSQCAPDPKVSLTTDGVTWSPIGAPIPAGRTLADGPAGVLMIGGGGADGSAAVWRLDP